MAEKIVAGKIMAGFGFRGSADYCLEFRGLIKIKQKGFRELICIMAIKIHIRYKTNKEI